MPNIQELLIFSLSKRFVSKFQVEILFLKLTSIFSLTYTTLLQMQKTKQQTTKYHKIV